jgi:thiol-disulfide isomerase/thioredoxin
MPLVPEPVRCPQIQTERWLNGAPVRQAAGDVVLVDFWDYTCANCLATLPYLREWDARYRDLGLRIAGVHAPEFEFARDAAHIERAIGDLGITWPVAIDNDYKNWQAYANRYWPAKYLADGKGYLRYYHFGEGGYGETEQVIQALLHELHPDVALPDVLEPFRGRDTPGAVCYRPTPELYLGYARGLFGHQEELREDRQAEYHRPQRRAMNAAYLDGTWTVRQEHAEAAAGASLSVWYQAAEVNLVLHPGDGAAAVLEIALDDAPVPAHLRGDDVAVEDGVTLVQVGGPRMYRLVRGDDFEEHELLLRARTPGVRAYAFTFVSCVKAVEEGNRRDAKSAEESEG